MQICDVKSICVVHRFLSPPQRPLYFFIRAGNWGEVKSKRAEPGENRTEGASAEQRGPSVSLIVVVVFRRTGETVSVSGLSDETVSVFVGVDNSLLLFSPLFDEGMSSSPTN